MKMKATNERGVWLMQVGSGGAYKSWSAFADEAKRMGFSRRVPPFLHFKPNDLILFAVKPQITLRKQKDLLYAPTVKGFGIVSGMSFMPRNSEARELLNSLLQKHGFKVEGVGLTTFHRACGSYVVDSSWRVTDWDGFFTEMRDALKEKGYSIHDWFIVLVNGKFYELEQPFTLPFQITYSRCPRRLDDDKVALLKEFISVEAFISDQPVIQILAKYIQCLSKTKDSVIVKDSTGTMHKVPADIYAIL